MSRADAFSPLKKLQRATSSLNMAAPWFRQNLESQYAQQKTFSTAVMEEPVELVQALEEAVMAATETGEPEEVLVAVLEASEPEKAVVATLKTMETSPKSFSTAAVEEPVQLVQAMEEAVMTAMETSAPKKKEVVAVLETSDAEKVVVATPKAVASTPVTSAAPWFRRNLASQYQYAQQNEVVVRASPVVVAPPKQAEAIIKETPEQVIKETAIAKVLDDKASIPSLANRLVAGFLSQSKTLLQRASNGLLSYRHKFDLRQRARNIQEVAGQKVQALLAFRPQLPPRKETVVRVRRPLSRRQEQKLAAKYAAIECIEERTYIILKDLGMIQPTLDFSI
ncbi:expressed unknown protein [Seminavis robusta]|uniref:Uncharacterized protein n=1 Tax=Seminavis robusta TaxID=568900 RepID=A0A9N8HRP9_9STRA|nr:expressed unknown protein [Seminavis robusta]|eukprot:Sro1345_g264780.1 n/a (338) ;mRNA; r:15578-16591